MGLAEQEVDVGNHKNRLDSMFVTFALDLKCNRDG